MTFLPRPIIAACGFACLIPTAPGCDAPPSEPRASASRLPDGRGSDPIPVDPIPVDPIPVDPIPVDPIPVDPAPAAAADSILLPPGVDRAALATGTVALFDGRTLFGWEVDEPGFVVRSDELRVSGPTEARITTTMSFPTGVGRLQFEQTAGKGVVVEIHQRPGEASYTMGKAFGSPGERPLPWTEVTMELRRDRVAILSENRGSASGKGPQPPVRLHLAGVLGTGFRNVLYRPDTAPLPLTTFTPVPGNAAKVTRENDELRLTGGPGFLRSAETYGDFVLQCEVKLNSADSNSGLFFRTVEPTAAAPSNGYEVQFQNTIADGDRTDPDDYEDGFGTGAIFRRQPARYVNADDGEWFHLTLVCVGNRMATWVNGLQVTDFTDDREPHPNPRKGRRDAPGYLVLQGHDPTTDVSFRNVRIQELASD